VLLHACKQSPPEASQTNAFRVRHGSSRNITTLITRSHRKTQERHHQAWRYSFVCPGKRCAKARDQSSDNDTANESSAAVESRTQRKPVHRKFKQANQRQSKSSEWMKQQAPLMNADDPVEMQSAARATFVPFLVYDIVIPICHVPSV